MRVLALTVAVVGLLLLAFGIFGVYTTVTDWEILGRSGSMMGLQPDHWRGHWLGTAVMYGALGLTFLCFPVGLWRHFVRHSHCMVYHSQCVLGSLVHSLPCSAISLWLSADSVSRGCVSHCTQRRQLGFRSEAAARQSDLTRLERTVDRRENLLLMTSTLKSKAQLALICMLPMLSHSGFPSISHRFLRARLTEPAMTPCDGLYPPRQPVEQL
jgi:hypothetical protein